MGGLGEKRGTFQSRRRMESKNSQHKTGEKGKEDGEIIFFGTGLTTLKEQGENAIQRQAAVLK